MMARLGLRLQITFSLHCCEEDSVHLLIPLLLKAWLLGPDEKLATRPGSVWGWADVT